MIMPPIALAEGRVLVMRLADVTPIPTTFAMLPVIAESFLFVVH